MDKTLKQAILNHTYRSMTNDTISVSVVEPSDLEHLINENKVVFFCIWILACGLTYFLVYSLCEWCMNKLDLIFIPIPYDDDIIHMDEPPQALVIPNQPSVSEFEPSLLIENHARVNICSDY